ncbi:MAG: V-type ATP synthase subunit A, partial [Spirochaetaceae bacterium]|nr:V-type ATP synthase subunit A [Spirochaetaceae bacterium]
MSQTIGHVTAVNGNMISAKVDGNISMNEVAYVLSKGRRLKSEVIRIRGAEAQLQVYEITKGIKIGDEVSFTGEMLSVELGPGLLGQIYDGLQNPLPEIATKIGYFLEPGNYIKALSRSRKWAFSPQARAGDIVTGAQVLGTVPENNFSHKVMVPFDFAGKGKLVQIVPEGEYMIEDTIAVVEDERGNRRSLTMSFSWPVKRAIDCYAERLKPTEPMVT